MHKTPHIVIVGGGFGGVEVAKRLAFLGKRGHAWITIVNASEHFLFTPLLHEVAGGGLSATSVVEPLREIFRDDAVTVREAMALSVQPDLKVVRTDCGNIPYDYLVIATGSTTNHYGVPGADEHTLSLKNLDDARRIRERVLDLYDRAVHAREGDVQAKNISLVVVGGGPTGVELSAELIAFCKRTLRRYYSKDIVATVTLVAVDEELLMRYTKPVRTEALSVLTASGVDVHLQTRVVEVKHNSIVVQPYAQPGTTPVTREFEADMVVWAAGVKHAAIPCNSATSCEKDGRFIVRPTLQSSVDPSVFVLGDSASGFPMLAQVAVAQGAVVAKNIVALIYNTTHRSEFTYTSKGQLVSLGRFKAAGEVKGLVVTGILAWFLWRTVYLFKFHSWRKRLRIMVEWTLDLFSPRDITR